MEPLSEELMKALHCVLLDKQTKLINTDQGTACMLPLENYIQLMEMKTVVEAIIPSARVGDILNIQHLVEQFSTWLLEESGNNYTRGEDAGAL